MMSFEDWEGVKSYGIDFEKLQKSIEERKQRRFLITLGTIIAVWIFIGNNIAGALVLFGLYMLGSMFDFWR